MEVILRGELQDDRKGKQPPEKDEVLQHKERPWRGALSKV